MPIYSRCCKGKIRDVAQTSGADLPDVNVWLAMTIRNHPHHDRATRYWRQEANSMVAFCRITALALIRLCCNGPAMGGAPLSLAEAMKVYSDLLLLPEVAVSSEPDGCEVAFRGYVSSQTTSRMITDSYLAAFALSGDMRLITFDNDFARFDGLSLLHLMK